MSIILEMPYPPSANRIWRAVKGRVIQSRAYREWLEAAVAAARGPSVSGPYSLTVIAVRPDRRKRDLDNLIKPVSDALARAGCIPGDHLAQRITLEWSPLPPIPGGQLTIKLEPLP